MLANFKNKPSHLLINNNQEYVEQRLQTSIHFMISLRSLFLQLNNSEKPPKPGGAQIAALLEKHNCIEVSSI